MANFKFSPKKVGISAMLDAEQKAQKAAQLAAGESNALSTSIRFQSPEDAAEKIRIIFDDSGSMSGNKITDAILGVEEFMRACEVNVTAVAVHPMNYNKTSLELLTTDLPTLAVLAKDIQVSGSTPMFYTLYKAQKMTPKATRYILFTDGAPNYSDKLEYKDKAIEMALEQKTPIDTVLIWETSSWSPNPLDTDEYKLLKEVADKTGGFCLIFDRAKCDFKHAFAFLAPVTRLALTDGNFRQKLQDGEI